VAEPTGRRDAYLLRGRRVLILDLMKASLISAGTDLVFYRPRLGATYTATVTDDGKLRLPDGRAFASPSRAASAAAGGSLDGWHAWQVAPDGEFLDVLRQRLLDQVAGREMAQLGSDNESRDAQSHHEFLRRARLQASAGTPVVVRVRELLAQWGAASRTPAASEQLAADLENHGLTTEPNFLKTGIDSEVSIVERQIEESDPQPDPQTANEASSANGDVGLTLGNIPSANLGVEAITPQASYEEAITRMLLNDYSQLAVMTGPRAVPRAVTWQSIARERHANPTGSLSGAIVEASTRPFDTELIDVLPLLESDDFVFVKDSTNLITGIVTTADVVRAYGELATPFFLIGELDRLLRQIISDNFTMAEVGATCDETGERDLQSYDDLTMGDYERLLQSAAHWQSLGWPLDRVTFSARLSELRAVRNDLVHFNPDPIPDQTVSRIRQMLQVLRRYTSA
jgi:CBS domain-containing protein